MIVLFRDNSVNYWLNNTVVDCGKSESNDILDIEFPEDISSDDLELLIETEQQLDNLNNKKLNNKHKHNKVIKINEPDYQNVFIGRNRKVVNRNPGKPDSDNKYIGYKYPYKDSGTRINDTQTSGEHKYLHKYSCSNYNKGKVRKMPKGGSVYFHE